MNWDNEVRCYIAFFRVIFLQTSCTKFNDCMKRIELVEKMHLLLFPRITDPTESVLFKPPTPKSAKALRL